MKISRLTRCATGYLLLLVLIPGGARAADACNTTVGRLVNVEGRVEIQHSTTTVWSPGKLNDDLCQGDLVRAGERSRATVQLINQAVLRIDQNTAMRLDNVTAKTEERSALSLLKGAFQSFSRKPRGFEVNTPYLNGSIEGTEFVFRVEDDESVLTVLEGTVVASNEKGKLAVSGGEAVAARSGQAPQPRTIVHPRDAVQWSLYYPPVMVEPARAAAQPSDAQTLLNNAASLLSVGRVDEARAAIDKALTSDPKAGLAYALRAVINVVQNDNAQALVDAKQAVTLSPDSAAAKIALSYAQQAAFDLPGARATLQQAVEQQPEDALAWARLSELQLMQGERETALQSAQQAESLNPDIARTQTTRGFAALALYRNSEARSAFERAIALDSADPLAHLGLGLARISAGDLAAGGRDIEVAVALDANDALLRAYLGKTYFEEKRAPLDNQQFDIAKQLDPEDPTAWLYSGIARQTQNQPVEAVQDLQQSIELNDNRAVYRSRLLLDKDQAARGTSLARAYNDLGFPEMGLNESTESLTLDPANASAHRFLSDTYRDVRRREVSRVSELLQAQMLQDINVNPIQPSVSSTNLNIVTMGGPSNPGFNEFTPLFEQNQTQLNVTGFGGNEDTHGGEAVVTTLHDGYSASGGAFHYFSDGFRRNADLRHKIYDLYGQAAVSPVVNLQTEFRHRDSKNGDLALNFNPDDYAPNYKRDFKEDTARIGARFNPDPATNILLSMIYSDRKEKQTDGSSDVVPIPFPPFSFVNAQNFEGETREKAYQPEAQYLYQGNGFNVTAGGAYARVDQKFTTQTTTTFTPEVFPPPPETTTKDTPDIQDSRGYVYSNIESFDQVTWTVGMSYQDYDEDAFENSRVNPKLGVQWDVTDSLRLRGAYFEVIKPALASDRTLEPTQVAGFNQFFDDANGTKSTRYGGALDWQATPTVYTGAELTRRKIETPEFYQGTNGLDAKFDKQDEWFHRAYAYWTPAARWGLSAEAIYDRYESDKPIDFEQPLKVKTLSFPLGVNYFHPSGVFGGVIVSHVDQKVRRSSTATYADGDSHFTVADLAVGYRLPRRRGLVSVAVQNLFDNNFDYQDDNYREFQDQPSSGPYIPDRMIMGRLTLNF
jgi:tetratricopeptide (TPR) repeat protein